MSGQTAERVVGRVPRGFSRYYVLRLLEERAMTGREIMDEAERRSGGAWRPSPGLMYPLLGRLLSKALVEEVEGGRYQLTGRGKQALQDYSKIQEEFGRQLQVVRMLGMAGRIVAEDVVDRVSGMLVALREELGSLRGEARERYRAFLRSELERLEREEKEAKPEV